MIELYYYLAIAFTSVIVLSMIARRRYVSAYNDAKNNSFYYFDVEQYEDKMLSLTYYLENGYNTYMYYKNELENQTEVGKRIYFNNVNHILNIHFKKLLQHFIISLINENNNKFKKLIDDKKDKNKTETIHLKTNIDADDVNVVSKIDDFINNFKHSIKSNIYIYNVYSFNIVTRFNTDYYKNIRCKNITNTQLVNEINKINNTCKYIDKLINIYNDNTVIEFNTVIGYINYINYLVNNMDIDISKTYKEILYKDCVYILYTDSIIRHHEESEEFKEDINKLYEYILM